MKNITHIITLSSREKYSREDDVDEHQTAMDVIR